MKQIEKILQTLGEPYDIKAFDGEDCIHRKFSNYEFEVSGTHRKYCTLYVWTITPRSVVDIYENIPTDNLKDILGYYSCKYQNLLEQIRVVRKETEV